MNEKEEKKKIRQNILQIRNALGREERRKASLLLTERILGHQWFYLSEYLLCYAAFGSEIDTKDILREALQAGKKVYLPKVLQAGSSPAMRFYRIETLDELAKGYHGIPEPSGISEEYPCSPRIANSTLMLMPGVAFDRFRSRLGYGKGFYDRFLSDKEELRLRTIGVGYACQLVETLPSSPTDIKPCQVICV